ncbi:MAG: 2-amino-4-hydroxy-6-hydroxymethyldihydropteridine diphosphokinase [Agromyces sp.]
MTVAIVALGSNLGDSLDTLARAVAALDADPSVHVRAVSPWYSSIAHAADGPAADAPRYVNGVAIVDADCSALELLRCLQLIEVELGRPADHARWTDRTVDLDLIVFGGEHHVGGDLTVPHPRAHERIFVLQPWSDLDPNAEIPGRGAVAELIARCPEDERAALQQVGS